MTGGKQERIRQRAFELWEQAGSPEGEHEQHTEGSDEFADPRSYRREDEPDAPVIVPPLPQIHPRDISGQARLGRRSWAGSPTSRRKSRIMA